MLKSRALRRAAWALGIVLVLWMLAWLALPPLLKWQIETRGSQALGRELRVGQVQFQPHGLALTLRDLSIAGAAPGDAPLLRIDRLLVDADLRSLWRLAPVIEALEIDAPKLRLARLADGRYDIDDLLQRFVAPPNEPKTEPARFAVFNLRVADGAVEFDDRPVGRKHTVQRLRLDLPFLSNLPDHLEVKVEPRLAFAIGGSEFDTRGRSTPFAQSRSSEFDIRFDKLALEPWWAYLPKAVPVSPSGGSLAADLKLRFEQREVAQVQLLGQIEVRDIAFATRAGAPLAAWQGLRLKLADVRPLERRVAIEAIQLDGLSLQVRRDSAGMLELQALGRPEAAVPGAPAGAPALGAPPGAASAGAPAGATSSAAPASAAAAAAPPAADWQISVALLSLAGAQVHWHDAVPQPAAELSLEGLELRLEAVQWPMKSDARLQVDARLVAQGRALGQLHADGALSDRQARIALRAADVDLAAAAPYLRPFLRPQLSAKLHAAGGIEWAAGDSPKLAATLDTLRVEDLKLQQPRRASGRATTADLLLHLPRIDAAALRADLLQRRASLASLSLNKPFVELVRDAQGQLSAASWVAAEAPEAPGAQGSPASPAPPPAAAPWQLELREFGIDAGRVRFADAALGNTPIELTALNLSVKGIVWPPSPATAATPAMTTQLSASLSGRGPGAPPARLNWRGRVSPLPAAASGQLRIERFPVHWFEPYFGAQLPVLLQRLEAGFKGEIDVRHAEAGLSARLRGDALLADLRVLARQTGVERELLSWNSLAMKPLELQIVPGARPKLTIGELEIRDYYSRLEITEEGRFNLQTVAAAGDAAAVGAGAAAPAASAAVGVSAPSAMLSRLPVDLVVGATVFSNGRVDFNDRFIRPNYSAELADLEGRVGRLDSSSRDMAEVQFSGRVAGTGRLEIGGSLNPTVNPPALDITAKATDIELPGLTPYSAKYAGYPIERGKLSVDVAYKIDADGKLDARNQIIVNQLTFGEKTDSPEATKLPVRLAVALLQDANGVIDLDLPVTGSISDPQFNIGALIWKVIVNILTKAVTAPFSLLAGGGGKDLSVLEFQNGTALITEPGRETIDKVAKALAARPALKLGINATADPVGEREAMQRAAFEARLLDEQRRELARGSLGAAASAAESAPQPLSAGQRERLVRQIYEASKLPDKPRNVVGMAKDIPLAEMEAMLIAAVPVDAAAGRQLAVQRGRAVRDALVAKGLGSERLFLGEPKLAAEGADNAARARLTLSMN